MESKSLFLVITLIFILNLSFLSAEEFGYNLIKPDAFNNNTAFVNASAYWITGDRGPLMNVSDIQHNWLSNLLWSTAAHVMDIFLDMNNNNIIDVNNLQINNNLTVGDKVIIQSDVTIEGRLFVGPDANTSQAAANPGDSAFRGNMIISEGSLTIFPDRFSVAAQFFNNEDDDPSRTQFYLTGSGNLNISTELFCDFTNNPFKANDTLNSIFVVNSVEFSTNLVYLAINAFVNSSCVIIESRIFGDSNATQITNAFYAVGPQPVFGVIDGGTVVNGVRKYFDTNFTSNQFGSYTRENTIQDRPGGNLFADAYTDSVGDLEYVFATQTGLNNSGSFIRNSLGIWSTRLYNVTQKQDLNFLHNMIQRWDATGVDAFLDYNSNVTGADLAVEHGIESQKLILHDDLGLGQLLGEGDFTWIARNNTDMEFLNGNGVVISKEVIKQFGFSAGDNITSLDVDFDSGVLLPFVQTTGGGAGDWELSSSILCHEGECARALGGSGSPLRSMQTNFSSIDQDNLNLSWWLTTVQSAPDVFTVEVNNNQGSGDVEVFTSSAVFADEFQSVILPSSMDNRSIVTVIFNFQGNNPVADASYVDEVLVVGNATITTLANVTVQDGSLLFGNKECGMVQSAEDGFQEMNITCDRINFDGNATFIDVTHVNINVTDDVSAGSFTLNSSQIFDWSEIVSTPLFPGFFRLDGTTNMQGNANFGSFNVTNASYGLFNDRVGVGTTNPTARLDIGSTSNGHMQIGHNSNGVFMEQIGNGVGNDAIRIQSSKSGDTSNYAQLIVDPIDGFAFMPIGTGNNNVGIGTDTPDHPLHIVDSASTILNLENTGVNGREWELQSTTAGEFEIVDRDAPAARMVIDTSGNIGIGTGSPQNSLDVSGSQVIGSSYAGVNTAPTDGLLVEGNVGIGTNGPGFNLEVSGTTQLGSGFYFTGTTFRGNAAAGSFRILDELSTATNPVYTSEYSATTGLGFSTNILSLINSGVSTMYLTADNKVGINTTTPQNTLNVVGDINATGNMTSDFILLGNGAYIGYNATCEMIFYNSTGGIISAQGCT